MTATLVLAAAVLAAIRVHPVQSVADDEVVDVVAYWAKVHKQCAGRGHEHASKWVGDVLLGRAAKARPDFFALAEMQKSTVVPPAPYEALGAACNGLEGKPPHLMGVYYDTTRWELEDVYPSKGREGRCNLTALTAKMEANEPLCTLPPIHDSGDVTKDWGECCGCVDHPAVSASGNPHGQGQRPFAVSRFRRRGFSGFSLCIVSASLPHPEPIDCKGTDSCYRMNDEGTAMFGVRNLMVRVHALCSDAEILFLADTNMNAPSKPIQTLFPTGRLSELSEHPHRAYTCCYDAPAPINRYAADRIAATNSLSLSTFGGSSIPGPMNASEETPFNGKCPWASDAAFGFICCGSPEEHSPLKAKIRMVLPKRVMLYT
eukprot:TRINITY_DN29675_c0_g1_i1.p1 TRINITY_DN29675_c0_g1~~TRINITY_DN29675_c0_g1_i1.p1  ORF type:complete len:374 (+),score=32.70 TRINITY_DN29675_c0_g1_i1:68-1189(+)